MASEASTPESTSPSAPSWTTVLGPATAWPRVDWIELWRYRDLLWLLAVRQIAGRYRQSLLGVGWAVIRPVIQMVIFTVIFGRVAGLANAAHGVPYPLFVFTGLLPWFYFSGSLTQVTTSVAQAGPMITKVYFPRLMLPMSSVAVGMVDLAIQVVVLLLLMVYYQAVPDARILLAPVFIFLISMVILAFGFWLTALNIRYRDIGQAVPFITQAWMYLTPVFYSIQQIPDAYKIIFYLNPLTGLIEGFRWSFAAGPAPHWGMFAVSMLVATVVFVTGLFMFKRMENSFADIV